VWPFFSNREEELSVRQVKKEIRDRAILIGLLQTSHVGRLGTIGKGGYPMVKPLNFSYYEGKIYFHSAQEGEKIDDIKRDNRICFEVDQPIALVKSRGTPCKAGYLYQSVIVKGRAHIVADSAERLAALSQLMEKYQPEGGYGEFSEEKRSITAIVRIDIEEITGKEDLGREGLKNAVMKALKENVQLPIDLEQA
jgi:uncharacterized protein